jgi:hypothetical protein
MEILSESTTRLSILNTAEAYSNFLARGVESQG